MAAIATMATATAAASTATGAYSAVQSRKAAKDAEKDEKRAGLRRKKALSDELKAEASSPTKSTSSGYGGTLGSSSPLGG